MDVMKAQAERAIEAAARHAENGGPMQSSAVSTLADARSLFERGLYGYARARAITSIRYSIGDPTQIGLPATVTPTGETT